MKLPVVALVGCSNVGKSTLFNRLTGSRRALVSDVRNLTRDRNYQTVQFCNRELILVDTGGFSNEAASPFEQLINQQVEIALAEASLILFMVDGRRGILPGDEVFSRHLRRLGKPVFLVVNKVDFQDESLVCPEFMKFGFPLFAISAEHNLAIGDLKEAIVNKLSFPLILEESVTKRLRVVLIGKPNVGKSTLINSLVGEERVIASSIAGTTRDCLEIPINYREGSYCFVDTAGIRKKAKITQEIELLSVLKANQAWEEADLVLILIDATLGITDQDLQLIGEVWKEGKLVLLVLTKADLVSLEQKKEIKSNLNRRLAFVNLREPVWLSAINGKGIGRLFKMIRDLYTQAHQEFKTNRLNQVLIQAMSHHQPPLVGGKAVKLRYVHFGHYNPITLILHGSRLKNLPGSYLRYLENSFRKVFSLQGAPLRLVFEEKVR